MNLGNFLAKVTDSAAEADVITNLLTFALKCPLSQARATLYKYCRQALSLVYMSAIFPCISCQTDEHQVSLT